MGTGVGTLAGGSMVATGHSSAETSSFDAVDARAGTGRSILGSGVLAAAGGLERGINSPSCMNGSPQVRVASDAGSANSGTFCTLEIFFSAGAARSVTALAIDEERLSAPAAKSSRDRNAAALKATPQATQFTATFPREMLASKPV